MYFFFSCKLSDVNWEPVLMGKPLMGSVTQSQRFSFTVDTLSQYINQYIFMKCQMTVCRNYPTTANGHIPQVRFLHIQYQNVIYQVQFLQITSIKKKL